MRRINLYANIFLVVSLVIVISFIIPTVYINHVFSVTDQVGNPLIDIVNSTFSIFKLIMKFVLWYPGLAFLIPIVYMLSVLVFGIFALFKSAGVQVSIWALRILLIVPLLVSMVSLYFFTVLGLLVFLFNFAGMFLLFYKPQEIFPEYQ